MTRDVCRLATFAWLLLGLSGCGLESAGSAATVAKLQAEQAKQGKETLDDFKAKLDEATQVAEERTRQADAALDQ